MARLIGETFTTFELRINFLRPRVARAISTCMTLRGEMSEER